MALVTLASFTSPFEAAIVQGRLASEGISAVVRDAETVTVHWAYSNAIGGVKVRVAQSDATAALRVLAEPTALPEEVGPYEPPTQAEDLAWRALVASVGGTLFLPIQLYALYLIVRFVAVSDGTSPVARRRIWWASAFIGLGLLPFAFIWALNAGAAAFLSSP